MAVELAVGATSLAVGNGAARTELLSESDTQVARQIIEYGTFPSLLLLSLSQSELGVTGILTAAAASLACLALHAAVGWAAFKGRKPQQRAALLGCCSGVHSAALPLTFAQALLGAEGLQLAALAVLFNAIGVSVVSYLSCGSAGAAFPEQQVHTSGTYRGEWKGMDKAGLGTYKWASGARYEGQWAKNAKDGYGIYFYPKGGIYKGEWREGYMDGMGVRVFKSGQLSSGRWEMDKLVERMPLAAVALAVEGADRAATAARHVKVGGGTAMDAVQLLTTSVPAWAAVVGCALAVARVAVPTTVAAVAGPLAAAHLPLALLVAGASWTATLPSHQNMADVATVMAVRLVPPLLLSSAAVALVPPHLLPLPLLLVVLFIFTGPLSQQTVEFVHDFRLDEKLAESIASVSLVAAAVVGTAVAGLTAFLLQQGFTAAVRMQLSAAMLAGAVAVAAAAAVVARQFSLPPRPTGVKMTFRGDAGALRQAGAAVPRKGQPPPPSAVLSREPAAGALRVGTAQIRRPATSATQRLLQRRPVLRCHLSPCASAQPCLGMLLH